ncbi:MAG: DMT family transporter, partial [Clostridia bacterium]|nr:DMT family transporter [Clostridia bacterium]
LGVIIVIGGSAKEYNAQILLGGAICILGAVSYGIFTALNKKMNYNKSLSLMTGYFAAFVLSTLVNLINGGLFLPRGGQIPGLLWSGVFTVAIADTLWAVALEKGKTEKISNLAYITPFLSLIWTSVLLNETIKLNSIIGLAVIIAGILIQLKDNKVK